MSTTIVVPCYNEEKRLPTALFAQYLTDMDSSSFKVNFLFVDDGSKDRTKILLHRLTDHAPPGRASLLALESNCGKAEAVRRGMVKALESSDCAFVGFWDCDLATPLDAVAELANELSSHPALQMIFGARVALLGRKISRSPVRHYLGRVFATLASLALGGLPIYDTQCGAKIFRATPQLKQVVTEPFLTRWVFDVEIIARFAALSEALGTAPLSETVCEFPLRRWEDVAGSKVRRFAFVAAAPLPRGLFPAFTRACIPPGGR